MNMDELTKIVGDPKNESRWGSAADFPYSAKNNVKRGKKYFFKVFILHKPVEGCFFCKEMLRNQDTLKDVVAEQEPKKNEYIEKCVHTDVDEYEKLINQIINDTNKYCLWKREVSTLQNGTIQVYAEWHENLKMEKTKDASANENVIKDFRL